MLGSSGQDGDGYSHPLPLARRWIGQRSRFASLITALSVIPRMPANCLVVPHSLICFQLSQASQRFRQAHAPERAIQAWIDFSANAFRPRSSQELPNY